MNKRIVLFLAAALFSISARSADCPFPASADAAPPIPWDIALMRLGQADCAGMPGADKAPLVQAYGEATRGESPEEIAEGMVTAMASLVAFSDRKSSGGPYAAQWKAIHDDLLAAQASVSLLYKGDRNLAPAGQRTAIPAKWSSALAMPQSGLEVGGMKLYPYAKTECSAAPCAAFDNQLDLLRVMRLMSNAGNYENADWLNSTLAIARRERKRWDAYRADGHHQYIWEVALNGELMKRDHCPRKEDASGERVYLGFCSVPTSQWIVLHPDAALRWSRQAGKSSDLKPAFVIEAIGYYRWGWGGDDQAKMVKRHGVSLAATYSDYRDEKRWSYGPMIHLGDYSLAVTKAPGGRWGLVLNLGLAAKIFDTKDAIREKMEKFH